MDILSKYRDSYRKRLLVGIAMKNPLLTKISSEHDLSYLLFGDRYRINIFLSDSGSFNADAKPDLVNVWQIILEANRWTTETFKDFGIHLNSQALNDLKKGVKDVVDTWIFNARDYTFISPNAYSRFSKESFKLQYDMVQSVWLVAAVLTDNHNLPLKLDKSVYRNNKILGIVWHLEDWVSRLRIVAVSKRNLKRLLLNIQKLIQLEPIIALGQLFGGVNPSLSSSERLAIYCNAMDNIVNYMKDRGIHFIKRGKPDQFYKQYWKQEYVMAYHVIMGLGKHLGFDPLFFRQIKDISFKKGIGKL